MRGPALRELFGLVTDMASLVGRQGREEGPSYVRHVIAKADAELDALERAHDKTHAELLDAVAAIDMTVPARVAAEIQAREDEREAVARWLEERGSSWRAAEIRAQAHRGVEVPRAARPARRKRATGVQGGAGEHVVKGLDSGVKLVAGGPTPARRDRSSNAAHRRCVKASDVEGSEGRCHAPSSGTTESPAERNPLRGAEENVSEGSPSRKEEVPDG